MPVVPISSLGDANTWRCGRFEFAIRRPLIMGIVNVTPDSFSDGGRFFDASTAIAHAHRLIEEGADLIDIGGESTRPDASEVSLDDELARVLPVVDALSEAPVALSIDTSKAEVMRAALSRGASVINDVRSLSEPGALDVVTQSDCGVVIMHMQGTPQTMQIDPRYVDVTAEVSAFLRDRCKQIESAGIARDRIALDPGFGFGKTHAHNFELLAHLGEVAALGRPLVIGISRKGMLKHATGRSVGERTMASAAAALIALERGARIVRVHDVAATRDALAVWQTTREHLKSQRGQA
jgi:dihydropteroate synthase